METEIQKPKTTSKIIKFILFVAAISILLSFCGGDKSKISSALREKLMINQIIENGGQSPDFEVVSTKITNGDATVDYRLMGKYYTARAKKFGNDWVITTTR